MDANTHPQIEALEAAAFRRLLEHLRLRQDVSNAEMMASTGYCRNCLADWLAEASIATPQPLTREEARNHVYGEPYAEFKARQLDESADQLARVEKSQAENDRVRKLARSRELDEELDDSFPASDPPAITRPR
ncbi:DUF1244 domain-containing protein [Sandaracinobacter sp. RS1-74]|uniref:DUF1244 domain-containing protein n=1 Tax=Sandaracinobacteroides sayramensis TaxID=2913411 RepID=UPI001EDA727B|nr:DUF1244 domain-containing protein [Sandaracinobacteroides sayramensis]MCG2840758.1 DUF1244 domain-containing protein [Sandaracinobacteroides sayramensis]